MAFGVAFSIKADLGVTPISSVPYVYSFKLPLTMGELTILYNIFMIILQIVILRKNFHLIQLLQLPAAIVFGYFIDFALYVVRDINPGSYIWQLLFCLLGCVVLALGVFLEVSAKLIYLPGEGLSRAVADRVKKEFGKVKVVLDSSMVILGIVSSFILFHQLKGIREGTIISALLVGYIVKLLNSKMSMMDRRQKEV